MSVEEHKEAADGYAAHVQVVVVSSTRTTSDDASGALITELLERAGHRVLARRVIDDDLRGIRQVLGTFATDGKTNVVVLTGGTGISRRDVTASAVEPLFDSPIPGFGEIFRALSYAEIGSAAMLSRATAGILGPLLVFAVPGSLAGARLATEKLIVPELPHLLRELAKEPATPSEGNSTQGWDLVAEPEVVVPEVEEPPPAREAPLPPPSGRLGTPGRARMAVLSEEVVRSDDVAEPDTADDRPVPPTGWRRAVYEVQGELIRDKREELPWDLEAISPVVDVLHGAGEAAVLKLPSGIKYSVFGWPDLRRDTSRVLAIGWGQPLAEVIALHRFPHLTGTVIEEDRGLVMSRAADVAQVCEDVTGQAPPDASGKLFAIQADTVWIQRGNKVFSWDGRREHDDGNPKQVISSLVLHWSTR